MQRLPVAKAVGATSHKHGSSASAVGDRGLEVSGRMTMLYPSRPC